MVGEMAFSEKDGEGHVLPDMRQAKQTQYVNGRVDELQNQHYRQAHSYTRSSRCHKRGGIAAGFQRGKISFCLFVRVVSLVTLTTTSISFLAHLSTKFSW